MIAIAGCFRKSTEREDRLVRQPGTCYHTDGAGFFEPTGNKADRLVPCRRDQIAALRITDHRRFEPSGMVYKPMTEARLHIQEFTIKTVDISIARHDSMYQTASGSKA